MSDEEIIGEILNDTMIRRPANQNTHWYKTDDGQGWTANPELAKDGEVEKRGLHDCSSQNCQTRHGSSAEEYADGKVCSAQTSRKAEA